MPVSTPQKLWLGRAREMAELEAALDAVRDRRGALFLATGEPGIGKTRLADEVGRAAAARGIAVHWGRAWEAGGAPAYWPFTQVLRSMCRKLDDAALRERVGPLGVHLVDLVPELGPRLSLAAHGAHERFQLFDAVVSFVHAVAERTPQLVVLDDLHAADGSSLQLLHFLARELKASPLVVVGTYRDAEVCVGASKRAFAALEREGTVLPLRRLNASETGELIASATGTAPKPEQIEAMFQRTEGNPLFLGELLKLGPQVAGRSTEGIAEVLRARVALLPAGARPLLEAAAVLGREFTVSELLGLVGTSALELMAALAPGIDAGIIEVVEQSARWRFTHVLLREELYAALPASRRGALHLVAARDVERRGGSQSVHAHHLLNASPAVSADEAARAAIQAASTALGVLGFEEAASLYERAGTLVEHSDLRLFFDSLVGAGVAKIRSGDTLGGKAACARAADVARALKDGQLLARAVLASTCEHPGGIRDVELIAWLEEALSALPAGDSALRARCLVQLAVERTPEPDSRLTARLALEGLEMARRLGDEETLRSVLANAGLAFEVGNPGVRGPLSRECLRLALASNDKLMAMRAHLFSTGDCFEQGDRAGLEAHANAYREIADELGYERFQWLCLALRAPLELWDGRFVEAAATLRLAREEGRGLVDGAVMAGYAAGLCMARERHDEVAELEPKLREVFRGLFRPLGACAVEMLIGQMWARVGNRDRCAAQLDAARSHPVFEQITEPAWLAPDRRAVRAGRR